MGDVVAELRELYARYLQERPDYVAGKVWGADAAWGELTDAAVNALPALLSVVETAREAWCTQPREGEDYPTAATWGALCDSLARLDGEGP